jgi:hypothetical protein
MTTTNHHSVQPSHPTVAGEFCWHGHMTDGVGTTFGPEPMATLHATADEIVFSSTLGIFRVPRSAVTLIKRGGMYPWFFKGLRVHHSVATLADELQFKPMDSTAREIKQRLRELGYPVA